MSVKIGGIRMARRGLLRKVPDAWFLQHNLLGIHEIGNRLVDSGFPAVSDAIIRLEMKKRNICIGKRPLVQKKSKIIRRLTRYIGRLTSVNGFRVNISRTNI